ncbi:hypothetical protein OIU74_027081 [Salix koriyanagi]|uniref:Uncharacterized protein n=1 Tax=Salix koriyanagi TaxID=2511006 RepID=A0A9Q0W0S6_9ROSI|nr:hypothetical protein OIU74_027081 [Salix koriyanagi]
MAASSSTTLVALCSSLTTQCKISSNQNPILSKSLCLSKSNSGSFSKSTHNLSSSSLIFSRKTHIFCQSPQNFLNLKLLLLKQSLKHLFQRLTLSLLPRRWLRLLRKSRPSVRRFLLLLW